MLPQSGYFPLCRLQDITFPIFTGKEKFIGHQVYHCRVLRLKGRDGVGLLVLAEHLLDAEVHPLDVLHLHQLYVVELELCLGVLRQRGCRLLSGERRRDWRCL